MNVIIDNPFRIIGILVGESPRGLDRQIKRLKQYIEAEAEPPEDYSFPVIGKLHRTNDSLAAAVSKLNLDNDKMNAALFWFYKGNDITDEPAFDYLKDSDMQAAIEIWSRLTAKGEITKRTSSAFQNLSTLFLCNSLNDSSANATLFKKGIILKLKFLESDFVEDLKSASTDKTFNASKKEIQLAYLNAVYAEIEKHGGITLNKLIEILNKENFTAKEDCLKGFVQRPIEQIERKIEESKVKRKSNKANAAKEGKILYQQTSESLLQIKAILGSSNLKFSSISDKVSNEVLQCGIDYFIHYRDTKTDPGNTSLNLFRKAEELAIGSIAIQRCQENLNNLQEWIDDKPERDKQSKIKAELDSLLNIFQEFESKNERIEIAKELITKCKPKLTQIKSKLGNTDDLYLNLSTRVASQAQSYVVTDINSMQNFVASKINDSSSFVLNKVYYDMLKTKLKAAWETTTLIGTLDLTVDFKTNSFDVNKSSLRALCSQMEVRTTSTITSSPRSSTTVKKQAKTYTPPPSKSWAEENPGAIAVIVCIVLGLMIGAGTGGGGGAIGGAFIGLMVGGLISRIFD